MSTFLCFWLFISFPIIYDQPHDSSFCEKLESVQYKTAAIITGAIQSTSREIIFQELGLESLKSWRWFNKIMHPII